MTAFGVNILAIGLGGIIVAAVTTAVLDFTGVLTATLFAIAGWLIIPARRRHLIKEFEGKISRLNEDLAALLRAKFEEQLARYENQLLEVVAPYERFLETERAKLESGLAALRGAEQEVAGLRREDSASRRPRICVLLPLVEDTQMTRFTRGPMPWIGTLSRP